MLGEEDSGSEEEQPAPEELQQRASEALVEKLVSLQKAGKLHANDVCILAHLAKEAGAVGLRLQKVAMAPGKASGNYSRHLTAALKASYPVPLYELECPGRLKNARATVCLPLLPIHELLTKEVRDNPTAYQKLAGATLPPAFHNHAVVRANPTAAVFPLALYMDGVPVTKKDGLLVITITNVVTGCKFLVGALKKSQFCKCGCRGWCTLWPLLLWLKWCFRALAEGLHPTHRADGKDFTDAEQERSVMAGTECARGCLLYLKGDWAEFAHSLAFPSWATKAQPCPLCSCNQQSMLDQLPSCTASHCPWPLQSLADLNRHCATAEIHCQGSLEEWRRVSPLLHYDKRPQGNRGRCLLGALPGMGLDVGDRLEPCPSCPDVGVSPAEIPEFPCPMTFWRFSAEEPCRHRNPLWDEALGLTPGSDGH